MFFKLFLSASKIILINHQNYTSQNSGLTCSKNLLSPTGTFFTLSSVNIDFQVGRLQSGHCCYQQVDTEKRTEPGKGKSRDLTADCCGRPAQNDQKPSKRSHLCGLKNARFLAFLFLSQHSLYLKMILNP